MIRYGSRYISLMGVLNLTPDSFEESSRVAFRGDIPSADDCLRRTEKMLVEGADIIDFGACSTRPGSTPVPLECEWKRLKACLSPLRREFGDKLKISLDTFRAEIVRRAHAECGAFLINDVSGAADPDMLPLAGRLSLEYAATHCASFNGDITAAVLSWMRDFASKAEVSTLCWYVDPGLGFGKNFAESWALMEHLADFRELGRPVLVGWSDKRMVRDSSGKVSPELEERALRLSLCGGASVIRTHSVERIAKMINFAP